VAEIRRVVVAIRATGIATLIVNRDDRAALAHTDRAVVLEEGQVVMAGASDTLDGAELGQPQGASSTPALAVGPRECGLARPGCRSRMAAPKEQFRCDPRSGARPARP